MDRIQTAAQNLRDLGLVCSAGIGIGEEEGKGRGSTFIHPTICITHRGGALGPGTKSAPL